MAKTLNRKVTIYIDGKEVKSTLASLEAEMRKLKAQQKNMVIGSEEYIKTSMKIKEITAVINEQKRAVNGLGNEWKETSNTLSNLGNAITGFASATTLMRQALGVAQQLSDEAAKMDDAYADVMKTTGMTHEEVEGLNDAFKKMDTRTSREQLNKLASEAGKLGIAGVDSVESFVNAADKINIALGEDLGEGAMVTIGKLAQVYSKSTKELADVADDVGAQMLRIGSALNSLGAASSANEAHMSDFLSRLGGVASQSGMSAQQILGFASALDQANISIEKGATAFQSLMMKMYQAPSEFADIAKMSVKDFQQMMETDMNMAIQKVLAGLNEMGGMGKLAPLFKDMHMAGAGITQTLGTLAANLDKVAEAQEIANEQMSSGNSIIEEANTKNNTMQARLDKARNALQTAREELGNNLYPIIIKITEGGSKLVGGLASLTKMIMSNKAALAGLVVLGMNLLRVTTLRIIANEKMKSGLLSLLGVEKLRGHQADVQAAKEAKLIAAKEKERLKNLQNTLSIEQENLARQQDSKLIEVQKLATITKNKVYQAEIAVNEQAAIAETAHANAIKASKAAFASTPWGLIITALTSIGTAVYNIWKNSEKVKLGQAMKEAGRAAYEAKSHVDVLFNALRNAKEGSDEYRIALQRIKSEYPGLIAQHLDEKGKLKDLEKAYKDLSQAAMNAAYNRVFTEKIAEEMGNLGESVEENTDDILDHITGFENATAEVQGVIRRRVQELAQELMDGKLQDGAAAYRELVQTLKQYSGMHIEGQRKNAYDLPDIQEVIQFFNNIQIRQSQVNALSEKYKGLMREVKGVVDDVNSSVTTTTETTNILLDETNNLTVETEAQRKAREKQEKAQAKAEAAWERFSNAYDQAMSKINARTLSGIEAIGAEIDAATQKMRTDIEAIDKSAHPEAAKMLSDLEAATEAWKRTKIDEYIAKTNKEIDKLAKSTAKQGKTELDKVKKATEELNQKFRDVDATIAQLTVDREILAAKDDDKSKEQLANIDAQIARFKELRSLMVGAVFAEIAPTVKNPFQKQEQQMNSFSYAENRAKALAKVQEEIEKYTQALDDAIEAEKEMERVATANGSDEEAEKHRKATEELEKQKKAVEDVRKEAEKLAKTKAVNVTLNKWADAVEKFGSKALSIFSNINSILSNISQQHLQELEDQKDEEIKMLDDQLEQGLISQENYDKRKEELETEYRDKAHEAELEDWRRQKAYGYSEAVINAAVAATKLWAGEGTTAYKIAMSALLAAEMATQIAAIASQPEPRAKGGYVESERLYRVGEQGREWIASNSLLTDPTTAPMIQALEAYQRGNRRALQMDQLNMPVVMQAARELGRRSTGSSDRFTASKGDDMLKVMKDLAKYLEDPKNRQAYISRQTQTDFDKNEDFLRNRASLG